MHMKKAKILHNPNAGTQEHSKKTIVSLLKTHGFDCGYSSTKEYGWNKKKSDCDFFVVAGGDGTVRRIVVKYLHKNKEHIKPILLLPLGTANNIAKSLGLKDDTDDIANRIKNKNVKQFDVGNISGKKKDMVFLESFGFGVFPELMNRMDEIGEDEDATPEDNLKKALTELHNIILHYEAKPFTVLIDGAPYTDHYLMIEVMNTPNIGPNLNLSPKSDPGDGELELVLIAESQREEFASYVFDKINGVEKEFSPIVIKGKTLSITTPEGYFHTDDELRKLKKPKQLKIEVIPGMLEFFVQ
jgi:diacylglycerol kinase family enzyme